MRIETAEAEPGTPYIETAERSQETPFQQTVDLVATPSSLLAIAVVIAAGSTIVGLLRNSGITVTTTAPQQEVVE